MNIVINLDEVTDWNRKEHNPRWARIPDHPYRIVIAGGFGSGKTNELLSLIRHQPDIDKIFFLAKDQYDSNYYYVIKKSEMLA